MPANLTPEYLAAEARFKEASSPQEKIQALEEMLRTIPKHKGTEKMQADIKRRLARLRKEAQRKGGGPVQRPFYHVDREGAGQVLLAGPPNSGKSQLLALLTRAQPEIGDFPFTTRIPLPGMLSFEDIQIQLVDMPPLAPESFEPWQTAMLRQGDAVLLLFDVNDPNLLDQTEFVVQCLQSRGIDLGGSAHPKLLILGNKVDLPGGLENFDAWQELYRDRFRAQAFSCFQEERLRALPRTLFELLEIVRVYTKAPGKKAEENPTPYVLKKGSTVLDLAASIHKDLAANFKFARIWSPNKYGGQMVERGYLIQDGDLIEIHA